MENFYKIIEYLPERYKSTDDQNYFDFLIQSVIDNYEQGNYHFSLVPLHMIYMGVVYNAIYAISSVDSKRFENILIGHHKRLEINDSSEIDSWQSFSRINETTIFQFYRAVGISGDEIRSLKEPVTQRNNLLHANGAYFSDKVKFGKEVATYLGNLDKIHTACLNEYQKLFSKFLKEISNEVLDEDEANLYLENFMRDYGVSRQVLIRLSKIQKREYPNKAKIIFNSVKTFSER